MDVNYREVIVDDEEASLMYLRSIIDQFCPGFRVVREANDGLEALQTLSEAGCADHRRPHARHGRRCAG